MYDRPKYEDSARPPLIKLVPGHVKTVLDIGCNSGAFGLAVKEKTGAEVWGVEPDSGSASAAGNRLDFVINDLFLKSNPLPDQYFDLICFNDSLEHMIDPYQALTLARSKLKTNGRVHCCVPNMLHVENLEHLIFDKDWEYQSEGVRDRTHLRFFTRKSLVRLFESAGYKVIKVEWVNESWWRIDKHFRRLFFRIFKKFSMEMRFVQFVVIAESF